MNKTKVQEELNWMGEETNFAETVNHFCWIYLFPRFKFLKNGWTEIMPDKKNRFYNSRRSRQEGHLGEGDCTFGHEERPEYVMQPEQ